ncbi:protein reticulata-related 4 [Quercus suber]|uniref:Protein reticulata-related 4 n=1 Tax=Quercus suber TaxID=58331 RepID=A0AAW0KXW6_QUESU
MTSIVTGLQGQLPHNHPKGYPFVAGSGNSGGGGSRGGGGDEGSSAEDKNREEALMVLAEAGRSLKNLPKDLAAAIEAGRVLGAVVSRFLELEKSPWVCVVVDGLCSGFMQWICVVVGLNRWWLFGCRCTTILDAIKAAVGDETEVVYEQYPSADTLARQDFSFAIVAVGEKPYVESLDDNLELVIQLNGADIISSVADSIPTLVILVSGRPLLLEPLLLDKIDALIAAWLPGSEGGGIADVVFGDNDFKGRLPVTWFKQVEQLPLHIGIDSCDSLFPLGFGLTCNKERSLDILSSGGSGPFDDNALTALSSDWAVMVDGFQKSALESRLGIPLIYGIDAVHGNNSIYGATIFPHNVGLGSTSIQMEGYWSCSFRTAYSFEFVIGMQIWFERLGKQQHLKLGLAAFTILLLLV